MAIGRLAMLLVCLLSAACVGRTPRPVAVTRSTDRLLDCGLMLDEHAANYRKAIRLFGERQRKAEKNAALGVVAFALFWPVVLARDLKGAESAEIKALRDRNDRLRQLMAGRKCKHIPRKLPLVRGSEEDRRVKVREF